MGSTAPPSPAITMSAPFASVNGNAIAAVEETTAPSLHPADSSQLLSHQDAADGSEAQPRPPVFVASATAASELDPFQPEETAKKLELSLDELIERGKTNDPDRFTTKGHSHHNKEPHSRNAGPNRRNFGARRHGQAPGGRGPFHPGETACRQNGSYPGHSFNGRRVQPPFHSDSHPASQAALYADYPPAPPYVSYRPPYGAVVAVPQHGVTYKPQKFGLWKGPYFVDSFHSEVPGVGTTVPTLHDDPHSMGDHAGGPIPLRGGRRLARAQPYNPRDGAYAPASNALAPNASRHLDSAPWTRAVTRVHTLAAAEDAALAETEIMFPPMSADGVTPSSDDALIVQFKNTEVLKVRKARGDMILNSGGWKTLSTRLVLNHALKPLGLWIEAHPPNSSGVASASSTEQSNGHPSEGPPSADATRDTDTEMQGSNHLEGIEAAEISGTASGNAAVAVGSAKHENVDAPADESSAKTDPPTSAVSSKAEWTVVDGKFYLAQFQDGMVIGQIGTSSRAQLMARASVVAQHLKQVKNNALVRYGPFRK